MKTRLFIIAAVLTSFLFFSPAFADDCGVDAIKQNVDKAAALVKEKGEAAFNEISAMRYCDGKGYVYVQDMDGIMLCHGVLPHLVGKNVAAMKDASGKLFAVEMIENVKKSGEYWFTYMWPKPGEKTASRKCGYAKKTTMNGKDVLVASGLYDIPDGQCGGK